MPSLWSHKAYIPIGRKGSHGREIPEIGDPVEWVYTSGGLTLEAMEDLHRRRLCFRQPYVVYLGLLMVLSASARASRVGKLAEN